MLLNVHKLNTKLGGLHILQDIDLFVNKGEIVVVVGANGSGKSTLMRSIAGLVKPESGIIEFEGKQIQNIPPYNISAQGISLVPEGRRLFQDMTVLENLQMGAYLYRKDYARVKKNLDWVFELFPVLKKYQNRKSSTFSGGEQQMLSIGRGLMSEPRLLMLDELSLGLAQKIIDMLFKIIKQLNNSGMSILMVEQNVRQALKVADRGYVLENGRIVIEGKGQELLDNRHVQSAYLGL
jgi:branched-chain amino acid transport system ATP-binding protein